MTIRRRDFLSGSLALAGASALPRSLAAEPARLQQPFFGLHEFIQRNPKAIFIRRTHVPHKMDEAAKRREGLTLARQILVPLDRPGVPVSHRVILKPNSTAK